MAGRLSLIAALAALLATSAVANDRVCIRETAGRTPALIALQASVDHLFDRAAVAAADSAPDGSTIEPEMPPVMEVLIVRVKNGKPVMACVDSKEAANRFLSAPVGMIGNLKAAAEEK